MSTTTIFPSEDILYSANNPYNIKFSGVCLVLYRPKKYPDMSIFLLSKIDISIKEAIDKVERSISVALDFIIPENLMTL